MDISQALTHPTLLHPLTGEPLRPIAVHPKTGRLVWPIMGGSGEGGDANDSGDGSGDGNEGGSDEGAGNEDGQDDGSDDGADDEAGQENRANRQAARYRTQLRETQQKLTELQTQHEQSQSVLQKLAAVFGGGEGNEDDPAAQAEAAAARVTELEGNVSSLTAALLVHELAPAARANPVALLDSRSFTTSLGELDASAADYRDKVAEAIKDAVSKNAAYRSGQGSGAGGSELDGEGREKQRKRPSGGLRGAIGASYQK